MLKNRILSLLICLLLLSFTDRENKYDQITVNYIANEGFMIQSGSTRILIDAIFDDERINYCDVPSKVLISKIENSYTPFDNVDVIFVSHYHQDHFSSIPVYNHLLSNKNCKLVCPFQVVEKLEKDCPDFAEIKNQITSISLDLNNFEDIIVNNIPIKVIRLWHSKYMQKDEKTGEEVDRHRNVENMCYIIDINDKKIVHVGDASNKNRKTLQLIAKLPKYSLVFLNQPFPFPLNYQDDNLLIKIYLTIIFQE